MVNGLGYREKVSDFLWPELNGINMIFSKTALLAT